MQEWRISLRYKLFIDNKERVITTELKGSDKRLYIDSCKKDIILFNIDQFAIMTKDHCETFLDKDAHKKVAGCTKKFLNLDVYDICKNVLKGKAFFDSLSLLGDFKEYRDYIIEFCELNVKTT
jgi:hypothetical protein